MRALLNRLAALEAARAAVAPADEQRARLAQDRAIHQAVQGITDAGERRATILEMRTGRPLGDQRGAWASWLATDEGLADFGRQLRAKVQQGATWAH